MLPAAQFGLPVQYTDFPQRGPLQSNGFQFLEFPKHYREERIEKVCLP